MLVQEQPQGGQDPGGGVFHHSAGDRVLRPSLNGCQQFFLIVAPAVEPEGLDLFTDGGIMDQ
jgi:hypothetical protein